jgi:hypothetical protein
MGPAFPILALFALEVVDMRLFLVGLSLLYVFFVSFARTFEIGPGACAVEADLAPFVGSDAAAAEVNAWRRFTDDLQPGAEGKIDNARHADRLFARYSADPVSVEAQKGGLSGC